MDRYSLIVEQFTIHDTRALHNDTLWLNVSAFVDGDLVNSWSDKLGDFNNGTYFTPQSVRDHPPTVINDPQSKVQFIFQLVNNGNVPSGQLSGRVAATADQLAGITSNVAGVVGLAAAVASGYVWAAIAIEGFANLWSWLDTDCDGPVAVDQVSGPRYWLDARTENVAHAIQVTRNYPGSNSPTGCGSNSNYDVEWSLNHSKTWVPVVDAVDAQTKLSSIAGVAATAHNEMLHVFGVGPAGATINHASTLKGVNWTIDVISDVVLATDLAPSAVSFDDRLHVFGVAVEGQVLALVYSPDGGSWWGEPESPPQLLTKQAIATVAFLDRLYVFARELVDEPAGRDLQLRPPRVGAVDSPARRWTGSDVRRLRRCARPEAAPVRHLRHGQETGCNRRSQLDDRRAHLGRVGHGRGGSSAAGPAER